VGNPDPLGLEAWVGGQLAPGVPRIRDRKAFHDPVLGTHTLHPHEVALLDAPLLQRLRYISQTGLAYLTFPGARHSRFEHVVGTATLVERFAQALQGRGTAIPPAALLELRIAALLHDVGHAFFSHTSEALYGQDAALVRYREARFSQKGPGEVLSHAIVTTDAFRRHFAQLCARYDLELDLDRIAGFIVGEPPPDGRAYLAEIISGPFDVDKLDYIHRDAHATGLRLVVDLDRFFYSITAAQAEDGRLRLAITAPEPLEQLIFSKMLLFATVYHHHKVKACDCLVRGAVAWARARGRDLGGSPLATPADHLRVTDIDFLTDADNPLVARLRHRRLLHRIVALSVGTVPDWEQVAYGLVQASEAPGGLDQIGAEIHRALPPDVRAAVLPEEIWLDIPARPRLKELSLARVARGQLAPVSAEELFPTTGWLNAYGTFRSRGHVFGPQEHAPAIYAAAAGVLSDRLGMRIDRDRVRAICHW